MSLRSLANKNPMDLPLTELDVATLPSDRPLPSGATSEARRRRLPRWLRADQSGLTWLGVVVAGVGFILIFVAWGQAAAQSQVYLQLPYIVSAGFTGIGIVMAGLAIVVVATMRRDDLEHRRQIDELLGVITELKEGVAGRDQA